MRIHANIKGVPLEKLSSKMPISLVQVVAATCLPERDSRGSNSRAGEIPAHFTPMPALMSTGAEWYPIPRIQEHGPRQYHLFHCPAE